MTIRLAYNVTVTYLYVLFLKSFITNVLEYKAGTNLNSKSMYSLVMSFCSCDL